MSRPKLLDLFCGAGGASMGYHRAGFDVTGVDLEPHGDYPFPMLIADAMSVLSCPDILDAFDVIAGSPPCPRWSSATPEHRRGEHPDFLTPMREAVGGRTYVIENVPGAPLANPVRLCGSTFGLGVRRHRLFETNVPMLAPECRHDLQPRVWGVYGDHGDAKPVRRPNGTSRGNKARNAAHAREVMGIDWMSRWDDLADAIPPAYTELAGDSAPRADGSEGRLMCDNPWRCTNNQPHPGGGRGCVHESDTGSEVPDRHIEPEDPE